MCLLLASGFQLLYEVAQQDTTQWDFCESDIYCSERKHAFIPQRFILQNNQVYQIIHLLSLLLMNNEPNTCKMTFPLAQIWALCVALIDIRYQLVNTSNANMPALLLYVC